MKPSLSTLLEKRGITDVNELSAEERETYERFRVVLTGENLTIATLKEFLLSQIRLIEEKIAAGPTQDSNLYLAPCLHVYLNLLKAIEAPEQERESLERHLTSLIND